MPAASAVTRPTPTAGLPDLAPRLLAIGLAPWASGFIRDRLGDLSPLARCASAGLVHPSSGDPRDLPVARRGEASIGFVHIRRALLLFAIVLGLAAIAASVSRTPEESGERGAQPAAPPRTVEGAEPSVSPGDATQSRGVRELVFDASRDQTRRVDAGQPATVLVEVDEPGLVEITNLGLSAPAEPLTPARFDVLSSDPERLAITFTPVDGDTPDGAGTLVVRETADG